MSKPHAGSAARLAMTVATLAIGFLACPTTVFSETATNIVLFIGDGMGLEQIRAGACFKGTNLCFETWVHRGLAQTRSANSAITDSAAAGTALATGHKASNGGVSVAIPGDGREYETVLEHLKRRGKRTGLVTTTSMTDATPAAFGAHERSRKNFSAIASDFLRQSRPNVLFGGGGNGMSTTGAMAAGYCVVTNRAGMLALDTTVETMVSGQFGQGNMPYEFDGLGGLPHLSEMTQTALRILARGADGFFLMVEGGRIDHACHANNITNCVRETDEFDNAVRAALSWMGNRTDTLMIVTADHETGGLTVLADNGPGKEPDVSWSSRGHTGTHVGVFARGPGADAICGVMDNTDIFRVMMKSQSGPLEAVGIERYALRTGPISIGGKVNCSGITFNRNSKTLFVVANNPAEIYELGLDWKIKRTIALSGFDDTEDIAFVGGLTFGVVEEKRCNLCIFDVATNTTRVAYSNAVRFSVDAEHVGNRNVGLEGVAYDRVQARFVAVKEKSPRRIYAFKRPDARERRPTVSMPWDIENNSLNCTDLSGVYYHEGSGHLLILSDESKCVVEATLDGREIERLPLAAGLAGMNSSLRQPEGITMDDDGNLHICCEPNLLYVYSKDEHE